jgi:hypothetical protein
MPTTYRAQCSCHRWSLVDADRVESHSYALEAHARHVRRERARERRKGEPAASHVPEFQAIDDAARAAEQAAFDRQWLRATRERILPERVADVKKKIAKIAEDLRGAAANLDRLTMYTETPIASLASLAQHDVLWMVANLNLDDLTRLVEDVHAAELRIATLSAQYPDVPAEPVAVSA